MLVWGCKTIKKKEKKNFGKEKKVIFFNVIVNLERKSLE